MGRKARATKGKIPKPMLVPKSPHQVQSIAPEEIHLNRSSDPPRSKTSPSFRKKSKTSTTIVRRSQRIRRTTANLETEPVIHEISISESDKVNEPLPHEDGNMSPEETSNETERSSQKGNPNVAEIYKNMYINSQKKVEELLVENRQLSKTLEGALGKVDVYEKQSHIYSEVMAVIASLSKVNENLSAHCAPSEDAETEGKGSKKSTKSG
ncbi:hypothetical protein Cgig2_016501 [Carnegiea gigantea]|uniref:Uncharacterized protein n=1 Tax=Carnegiea gigantea TaxID=171969 RepID=A0A9Q1JNA9_9CARY|nr:hypothetical protein Cgig2_016501 [Carnegiea gigantea]